MNKKDDLIKNLKNKYHYLNFCFEKNSEFEYYLLYKEIDEKFHSKVIKIDFIDELDEFCSGYLDEREQQELVIVYDYSNKLQKNKITNKITIDENFINKNYNNKQSINYKYSKIKMINSFNSNMINVINSGYHSVISKIYKSYGEKNYERNFF